RGLVAAPAGGVAVGAGELQGWLPSDDLVQGGGGDGRQPVPDGGGVPGQCGGFHGDRGLGLAGEGRGDGSGQQRQRAQHHQRDVPDAAGSAAGGDEALGELGEAEILGAADLQELAAQRPVTDGEVDHGGDVVGGDEVDGVAPGAEDQGLAVVGELGAGDGDPRLQVGGGPGHGHV